MVYKKLDYDLLIIGLLGKTKGLSFIELDDFITSLDDGQTGRIKDNDNKEFKVTKNITSTNNSTGEINCEYILEC